MCIRIILVQMVIETRIKISIGSVRQLCVHSKFFLLHFSYFLAVYSTVVHFSLHVRICVVELRR